ncbi:unnamed protein product [Fusarium equiseti]|uniref:MYND-type zinc finger protein samB n=1 Tax=Fusarium equiseti TaxID=61235 RepID=A0A8J2NBG5_FUSEQ|nr:unnamed protein product [Fusarium equiseti]
MPPRPQSSCKLSPRACEYPACGTTESNLLRCSACKAVYYCRASRLPAANSSGTLTASYQVADRERHTKGCNALKNARMAYANEDKALRKYRDPTWSYMNVFEYGVGDFWDISQARDYMHARHRMIDVMLEVFGGPGGRVDAVKEALYHLLEMLKLSRSDNMGVRDTVPGLYIRLNEDQAAYDLMKWYATTDKYDWNIETTPYFDVNNADILEDPPDICVVGPGPCISSAHVAAVLLIKVRILLDLQAAQNATRAFEVALFLKKSLSLSAVTWSAALLRPQGLISFCGAMKSLSILYRGCRSRYNCGVVGGPFEPGDGSAYRLDGDDIALLTGRGYLLFNITNAVGRWHIVEETDSSSPMSFIFSPQQAKHKLVLKGQDEWLTFRLSGVPDFRLSISMCFDSFVSVEANVTATSPSDRPAIEPILGIWDTKTTLFNTTDVRTQLDYEKDHVSCALRAASNSTTIQNDPERSKPLYQIFNRVHQQIFQDTLRATNNSAKA